MTKINVSGEILTKSEVKISPYNRALKYGDAIFETLKSSNNKIHFIEDHYFRIMSSMRMLRMDIPMHFTLNFFKNEIQKTIFANSLDGVTRVRFTIFRKDGGLFLPKTNEISYLIEVADLQISPIEYYEIEIFKDFQVFSGKLSNLKTNNRILNVVANIFAEENDYQNCILINEKKNIVEAINANIFLIKGNTILTPALSEGCINGIIRKKLIEIISKSKEFKVHEVSILPIELLHADEVFLTNSIVEIQSVTNYRKKKYGNSETKKIEDLLRTTLQ